MHPSETEAGIDLIVRSLNDIQVTRYLGAAGLVALLYDHLLTMEDEVEYVWPAKNTVPKIMFLLLRYMVPFFLIIHTTLLSGLSDIRMSNAWCKGWLAFSTYIGWSSIAISNFLVLLRIYTFIPRRHKLVIWIFVLLVAVQVASFVVTTWTIVNMIPLIAFKSGVCVFVRKPNLAGLWVVGLAFEVLVFAVTCWNTLDRPRHSESAVLKMLLRDGAVYFFVLFGLRTANTVIAVAARPSLLFVGVFTIWAGATITTSRLIINSRKTARLAIIEAQSHERPESQLDSLSLVSTSCT